MELIPKKKEGFTIVELGNGELGLANMEEGYVIKTDPVVLAIWLLCDGKKNIEEISRSMVEEYNITEEDIPFENLKENVKEIVDLLVKEGVLEY